jgi:hypothetical protein
MVWMIAHFSEPRYQGKSLRVWLDEAGGNGEIAAFYLGDDQPATSSARAVRAIGTDAIPILIGMARTRESGLRKMLVKLSRKHAWISIHARDFLGLHYEAAYGFGLLGPSAKAAVPDLIALLDDDDPEVRCYAAMGLGNIGRASAEAVPDLRRYLEFVVQDKPGTRWDWEAEYAISALGEIGPAARPALAQITAFTNTGSYATEVAARAALIQISGSGLDTAVEPLKDTSHLRNWCDACEIVSRLGTNGAPAISLLLADLQQTNEDIQMSVIQALGRIHTHPDQCIPAMTPFLRSTNGAARFYSLLAISAFGSSAGQWAPTSEIVHCLTDSDDEVRAMATNALRRVAAEAATKASVK